MRQLIKRILREEKEKDLSPLIKKLLKDSVIPNHKMICTVDVVAPRNRGPIGSHSDFTDYQVRVNVVGGINSKYWPMTQYVHKERDNIVNDVWHTVYNFMGLSTDVFLRNVKSCDEVLSESLEDIQGTPLYHHTTESRALSIMNSDMMRATRPDDDVLELDPTLANTKHQSMVSFTRDKNFIPDQSVGASVGGHRDASKLKVIFVVDKDKIKSQYKIVPFDYSSLEDRWYDKRMKDEPDTIMQPRAIRTSKSNEYEERVLTNKIQPLSRYVTDIIYKGDNPLVQQKIDEYLNRNRPEEQMNEGLHDTSWENDEGDKVTLIDLLDATEEIPVKNIPVDKIKSKLLTWDNDDKEIAKIEKADLEYPILIFVDDNNKFISIIDGHHRAQKAVRHKLEKIKAKLIPINSLPKNIRKVFGHLGKQEQNESIVSSTIKRRANKQSLEKYISDGEINYPTLCDDFEDGYDYADAVIDYAIYKLIDEFDEDIYDKDYYDDVMDYLRNFCRDEFGQYLIDIYKETCTEEELDEQEQNESELTERCWKGYTQKGMKTMFGKRYPNCVKTKK